MLNVTDASVYMVTANVCLAVLQGEWLLHRPMVECSWSMWVISTCALRLYACRVDDKVNGDVVPEMLQCRRLVHQHQHERGVITRRTCMCMHGGICVADAAPPDD